MDERQTIIDDAKIAREELRATGKWEEEASLERLSGRAGGKKLARLHIEAKAAKLGSWRKLLGAFTIRYVLLSSTSVKLCDPRNECAT